MTTDIIRHKIFRKSSKWDHPKFLQATVLLRSSTYYYFSHSQVNSSNVEINNKIKFKQIKLTKDKQKPTTLKRCFRDAFSSE